MPASKIFLVKNVINSIPEQEIIAKSRPGKLSYLELKLTVFDFYFSLFLERNLNFFLDYVLVSYVYFHNKTRNYTFDTL